MKLERETSIIYISLKEAIMGVLSFYEIYEKKKKKFFCILVQSMM
jgi:hypothetical protein